MAAPPQGDALWIWSVDRAGWPDAARIMRREGFSTAFLSIPPTDRAALEGRPAALDDALAPFAERGITVLLAGGDPAWVLSEATKLPPPLVGLVRLAAGSSRVAGVQLDVEPYTLPLWRSGPEGRARIAAGLMDLLDAARAGLAREGKALGTILHPAFANAALSERHGAGTMADGAVRRADRLVVMAYRNTPDGVGTFARRLLPAIDAAPRPWHLGVTVRGGQSEPFVSYHGLGIARLRADMNTLRTMALARPSGTWYLGAAVHAYTALLPMLDAAR
ncbi:hypothetical protein HL658_18290 [Azospirillum sp. RWY-5-1]|uniref:Uncharacterized protein n=1 Tax=Azospirillum oleiclasticum TaxID=2735135 RepID=A0ABX2TFN1_9PROT|nr:hypothetical protein [Azospirillum oleiclasticum]NYZ14503.1 hypothetical protein [Azospirillum oleiclasticum]NYZ23145.1 hypothetical protein [Azospirillum oleiclasticum]